MIIFGANKEFRERVNTLWDRAMAVVNASSRTAEREVELTDNIVKLKVQISNLEIDKSKKQEYFERRERELEHKIGLVKKSQEFELESQRKRIELELKEANLTKERAAFEKEMSYIKERMEMENKYVREMLETISKKIPSAEIFMEIKKPSK